MNYFLQDNYNKNYFVFTILYTPFHLLSTVFSHLIIYLTNTWSPFVLINFKPRYKRSRLCANTRNHAYPDQGNAFLCPWDNSPLNMNKTFQDCNKLLNWFRINQILNSIARLYTVYFFSVMFTNFQKLMIYCWYPYLYFIPSSFFHVLFYLYFHM